MMFAPWIMVVCIYLLHGRVLKLIHHKNLIFEYIWRTYSTKGTDLSLVSNISYTYTVYRRFKLQTYIIVISYDVIDLCGMHFKRNYEMFGI